MELRLSEEEGACLRSNSKAVEDLGLEPGSSGVLQEAVVLACFSEDPGMEARLGLCRGPPWRHAELLGLGKRPGLVRSAVGPLDGDVHGGEEAGWSTGTPSRCWGPAVHRLPSNWEL